MNIAVIPHGSSWIEVTPVVSGTIRYVIAHQSIQPFILTLYPSGQRTREAIGSNCQVLQ